MYIYTIHIEREKWCWINRSTRKCVCVCVCLNMMVKIYSYIITHRRVVKLYEVYNTLTN